MNEQEYKELVEKLGKDAADRIKTMMADVEKTLNDKWEAKLKGLITDKEFADLKKELQETQLKEINEQLAKLDQIAKDQGTIINEIKETRQKATPKSLQDFFQENIAKISDIYKAKSGTIEWTGEQLKAAGVTSITGSISDMASPPGSPYLPGIAGTPLEMFEIVRNPNWIITRVDVGRTNQSRLAWINEVSVDGDYTASANVSEGGTKPKTQHKFQVEISTAKKAAAYIELTEEFEDDVPQLATAVRRMLRDDVIRAFDDQVQTDVIAAARPYEITGLDGDVVDANLYDAIGAMLAQIAKYNFIANTIALNPVTEWKVLMQKDSESRYLMPPFLDRINRLLIEATKVAEDYGLVGDLSQYKVDIYKEFTLRVGWINDQFITNKFSVVGELRYHSYISDNRKKAIVYDSLIDVMGQIDGASVS